MEPQWKLSHKKLNVEVKLPECHAPARNLPDPDLLSCVSGQLKCTRTVWNYCTELSSTPRLTCPTLYLSGHGHDFPDFATAPSRIKYAPKGRHEVHWQYLSRNACPLLGVLTFALLKGLKEINLFGTLLNLDFARNPARETL